GEGISPDFEKVEAIQNLRAPTNCKELRQCLEMASWYRRLVPNFATLVQPMTVLLKKGRKWSWGEEEEDALRQLKEWLTTASVLACPDFSAKFVLQTDASDYGLGAVLMWGGAHLAPHCPAFFPRVTVTAPAAVMVTSHPSSMYFMSRISSLSVGDGALGSP
ncbi:hypothetical protein ACLKA7_004874, partial [Drosophila subpalustris]